MGWRTTHRSGTCRKADQNAAQKGAVLATRRWVQKIAHGIHDTIRRHLVGVVSQLIELQLFGPRSPM